MSDHIGHECGLAFVRLLKPLSHFAAQYGDAAWGLRRAYLMMQKQYNRGQDGAGLAVTKFDMPAGEDYISRVRSDRHNAIERIFDEIMEGFDDDVDALTIDDELAAKVKYRFLGEVCLGHLRYGTHHGNSVANCHPQIRRSNVSSRHLTMAGNFNMTNAAELFSQLVGYGLNPTGDSDTSVILEKVGYFLDEEHRTIEESTAEELNGLTGLERSRAISSQLDIVRAFSLAAAQFDGGYILAGMMGNGDSFIARDPNGIRPAYFLQTDEFIAAASERPPLANVFNVDIDDVHPINPGHILAIKRDGSVRHEPFIEEAAPSHCTFERIYFSRGNDPAIYEERKQLGRSLAPRVLDLVDHDVDHTVFSFIPNTAESAYLGMVEEVDHLMLRRRADRIWAAVKSGDITHEKLIELAGSHIRAERLAHKDQRLRTFITHDAARRDLVEHIYDITRGVVNSDDNLVVIDDSIVRGTTLRESILTSVSRLNPKRIVVVSSAPPIMYPDCYGIDMSQLSRFVAFEAAVALLEDRGESSLLDEVETRCLEQATMPPEKMVNQVGAIYDRFSLEELEAKIGELLRPKHIPWEGELDIIYQSVEGLQSAMPETTGDWYFTGNYPTPGGYAVLNTSYLNWRQGQSSARAY